MEYKNSLTEKMLQLRESRVVNQRFYHLQSTANFIAFFDKLNNISERERVYLLLNNYLDVVKQEPVEDAAMSMELFNEFIRPVGWLYEDECFRTFASNGFRKQVLSILPCRV